MRSFGIPVSAAALALGALATQSTHAAVPTAEAVLVNYADIAAAAYEDAWRTAKDLRQAVDALLAAPSEATQRAAQEAWLAARVPYQQTEAYRFGNAIVDDWEGRVNAWPLDEGLIDYVAASYGTESDENLYYVANVVAHPKLAASGATIDASVIDAKLLHQLHEIDAIEANVATGYHAVEFLHRTGRGRAAVDRLPPRRVHRRQLRAAARLSEDGDRSPGHRSRRDGRQLAGGRRGARGARRWLAQGGPEQHRRRARQPLLRRAGGRADEARTDAP
jgi:hypothetical protein